MQLVKTFVTAAICATGMLYLILLLGCFTISELCRDLSRTSRKPMAPHLKSTNWGNAFLNCPRVCDKVHVLTLPRNITWIRHLR